MSHGHDDHGPKCPNCGKEVRDEEMACYHCEHDLDPVFKKRQKPQCFIATAVYGEHALKTQFLRDFRDESLEPHFFGRVFVGAYYFISPTIAFIISKNKKLKSMAQKALDMIVLFLQKRR